MKQEKIDSHRPCFDETCRIELGRALAARKTMSARIMNMGKRCMLIATLFDIETETADKAASSTVGCTKAELTRAVVEIARQLR
jgi:hypothetical protein